MTRERALMVLVCGLWLLAPGPTAGAKTKARCTDGSFRITAGAVLASAAPDAQWIAVEDATVAVGGVCPAIAGTVGGSVRKTKVKAAWPAGACTGLEGPVRLKAKIVSGCAVLKGTLRAPRSRLVRKLEASRTSCGDGVVDPDEACETSAQCADGGTCDAGCTCQVPATTTSSTSSTSTSVTTTTFQGALAPDYIMFSGMETASDFEPSLMLGCAPVQNPVRSGRWACGMTQDLFAPLRPSFSVTEIYVRVYHRIDVTTAPSAEAFAPVIVTDIAPQGVTAVDVGVSPDGSIRYRLRDRLNGINLGVSESFAAGQWRRIELFTAIGDGDGRAELRIEGVPTVIVTNQNFGTKPMDTIFLSNNSNQYGGANGGSWRATFDDFAITRNVFPGAGRVIARQGRPGTPTHAQWSPIGAASVSEAWSETPGSAAKRAETPAVGDPLAQTMLVAPFDQGINPIAPGNTIKACQTWARFGLLGSPENRSYAIRRRIAGVDTDTPIVGLETGAKLRSDGLDGAFWRATLADLNASEVGAAKSGGAGGTGLSVEDAWLVCEYQ